MLPVIAIVGRPNVGKSTLFNRLCRSRGALVDDQPGVTRDRLYATARWADTSFTLVDTGGFDESDSDPILSLVKEQVFRAVEQADRVLFLVDGREGVMAGDREIAEFLRRSGKEVFLVVNKVDGLEQEHLTADFYSLGFSRVHPISAAHGYGLRQLMGDLVEPLPETAPGTAEEDRVRVAVLGRPNVGKSSLVNHILGEERLVVSEVPGTTRDAIDILCEWKGKEYLFIDTAGIRRKGRVREKIEKFSAIKALKTIERCHVAVILLDASAGVTDQDARICGYAYERGRAILLAVNKWDLVKKNRETKAFLESTFERHTKFLSFAPRLNVSALTGEGVSRIFGVIDRLYEQFSRRLATGELNKVLVDVVERNPPPKEGRVKIFYATQTGVKPPTFVAFVNHPEKVHFSYQRFLVNQLRERLGLEHTPIRLIVRGRGGGKPEN